MTILLPVLAGLPLAAAADPGDGWSGGYGHMMWGGGLGMLGGLLMLAFWAGVIALAVLAIRRLSAGGGSVPRRDALDTLRERFAAGEIDEEEYRHRKQVLES